jgi:hypothetical protein
VQNRPVVVQADPLALVADQLEEPVPLEGEPDELVDRVAEDQADDRDDRCDQAVRDPGEAEATRCSGRTAPAWPATLPA